ncbi:efflux transporter outer membrane subunit [Altererythrobacter sp. GH1-8]|uniref:efflux transporter outer membrane subunit n=1 Tax=Altererythrobacter sp. GH1-8 TaxID=3349333 RepID=UPI00374DD3BD
MKGFNLPFLLGASACLASCMSMAPSSSQTEVVKRLPETFSAGTSTETYAPRQWWAAFEDPTLDALVDDALRDNLDIAEAAARLNRARAQARVSKASLFPSVDASAGATSTSNPLAGSAFGNLGSFPIDRIENDSFSTGVAASYELDLFGRARNDFAAAKSDALASRFDYQAVQLSAAAETISTYFDLVDTERQLTLAERTSSILQDRAKRTEERFQRGVAESFELYQVRQDLRATEASIPQLRSQLSSTKGRLAVLVRQYPDELEQRLEGPLRPRLVFDPIPAGLPIDLLAQRPDVAAAWSRFEAARLRIGARRAERFPRISLSGSLGTQANNADDAFDFANNWTRSLAANLLAPLFDAGRISANIKIARANYDEQAASYSRTVLNALREVETALTDYDEQRDRYLLIARQLDEARSALDLQEQRFASGVGSYIAYLDALRTTYQVEAALSSAARSAALARLGVHRALGGDWGGDRTSDAPAGPAVLPPSPESAAPVVAAEKDL